ncbi:MAG TPA: glycosyl hydrolase [Actinoplanes sp.]|jgi:hypothetical protein
MTDEQQGRRLRTPIAAALALIAVVALLVVIGSAVLIDDAPPAATTTAAPAPSGAPGDARRASAAIFKPRTPGTWPGPDGLSGVNGDPLFDTAHVQEFCTARGRACKVAQTYTDRTTYQSMTGGTGWTFDNLKDFPGVLIVSQGLVPEGRPQDLATCAQGGFDRHWRDFGALMVRHGRGDSVVRLGWEFNGDFMAWSARDPQTWIACYRRAADGIRATNPAVVLDWTINAHDTAASVCGGVSTNCYPGDDYVDIIGIDNYDHFPATATKAEFDRVAAEPEGLDWLFAFARAHGKPFSVGEWGVVQNADGGGDNPGFVRWMHEWFAEHAADLAYEAYFTNCEESGIQSSLFRDDAACARNPKAAGAYRGLFAG